MTNDSTSKPKLPDIDSKPNTDFEGTPRPNAEKPLPEGITNQVSDDVQARIQDSVPNLIVGDTTMVVKPETKVSSTILDDVVTSTLSYNNKPFAQILTRGGQDTLKLLDGYKDYATVTKDKK